jgi:UDP-glucose 4-epimerase
MVPTSTYGASKLAGEALLASYAHMFDFTVRALRFGNVVGPRQTHGVGYDFVRRLLDDPACLSILGDGRQSKSYVYVSDIVDAVLLVGARADSPFDAYNVATGDYLTVAEIAEIAMDVLEIPPGSTRFAFTGGDRGWKGDIPVVRINTDKIRALGWSNRRTSRQAMRDSMVSMAQDVRAGRLTR